MANVSATMSGNPRAPTAPTLMNSNRTTSSSIALGDLSPQTTFSSSNTQHTNEAMLATDSHRQQHYHPTQAATDSDFGILKIPNFSAYRKHSVEGGEIDKADVDVDGNRMETDEYINERKTSMQSGKVDHCEVDQDIMDSVNCDNGRINTDECINERKNTMQSGKDSLNHREVKMSDTDITEKGEGVGMDMVDNVGNESELNDGQRMETNDQGGEDSERKRNDDGIGITNKEVNEMKMAEHVCHDNHKKKEHGEHENSESSDEMSMKQDIQNCINYMDATVETNCDEESAIVKSKIIKNSYTSDGDMATDLNNEVTDMTTNTQMDVECLNTEENETRTKCHNDSTEVECKDEEKDLNISESQEKDIQRQTLKNRLENILSESMISESQDNDVQRQTLKTRQERESVESQDLNAGGDGIQVLKDVKGELSESTSDNERDKGVEDGICNAEGAEDKISNFQGSEKNKISNFKDSEGIEFQTSESGKRTANETVGHRNTHNGILDCNKDDDKKELKVNEGLGEDLVQRSSVEDQKCIERDNAALVCKSERHCSPSNSPRNVPHNRNSPLNVPLKHRQVGEHDYRFNDNVGNYSRPWLADGHSEQQSFKGMRSNLKQSLEHIGKEMLESSRKDIFKNISENGIGSGAAAYKHSVEHSDASDLNKFKSRSSCSVSKTAGKSSRQPNVMKFAEILYKCTLCTTIPTIMTSKENFACHINQQHLSNGEYYQCCQSCSLKFRTEEDLKEHMMTSHTGSDVIGLSRDQILDDITESHDHGNDSNNDSDSDSSGHRQLRTRVHRKSKPVQDFESPKQLVDHTGIETWNGSLDLSKRHSGEADRSQPRPGTIKATKSEFNDINIKKITEQIIKSDVQCRNQKDAGASKVPLVPCYTPEFGKYTKLVREGGNIVYFCQICNWKSPIKTTFQAHCNMTAHKNKVLNADNPDSNCSEKAGNDVKASTSSSSSGVTNEGSPSRSNSCKSGGMDHNVGSKHKPHWLPNQTSKDTSYAPKFSNQSLFYDYIVQTRGLNSSSGRTPVVAYGKGGGGASIFENSSPNSKYSYQFNKRSCDTHDAVDLAMKKRKKMARNLPSGRQSSGRQMLESESDDEQHMLDGLSGKEPWKLSTNMALLRHKLLGSSVNRKVFEASATATSREGMGHEMSDHSKGSRSKYPKSAIEYEYNERMAKRFSDPNNREYDDMLVVKMECGENGPSEHKTRNSCSPVNPSKTNHTESKSNLGNMDNSRFTAPSGYMGQKSNKCHACSFEYTKIEEYEKHFDKVHKSVLGSMLQTGSSDALSRFPASMIWAAQSASGAGPQNWMEAGSGSRLMEEKALGNAGSDGKAAIDGSKGKGLEASGETGNCEMGENWRVQKLKELLPEYAVECEKGNTSRDNLLQVISTSTEYTDAMLWSSACNRAVRELFPNSQAQRKGKYKKTFYFGLSMLSYQMLEEQEPSIDGDAGLLQLPPRDISMDMERIVEQLPAMLKWTGCLETGVYREELLAALGTVLHDPEALNWGAQCNRAIRLVFPLVDMKRKGKFKATMYLGVEFYKSTQQLLAHQRGLELFCLQQSEFATSSPPPAHVHPTESTLQHEESQRGTTLRNFESALQHEESKRGTTLMNMLIRTNSPLTDEEKIENSAINSIISERPVEKSIKDYKSKNSNSSKTFSQRTATETVGRVDETTFSESIRKDAQAQMEEYLLKFGGVSSVDSVNTEGGRTQTGEDNANDGDDEGESLDSGTIDI